MSGQGKGKKEGGGRGKQTKRKWRERGDIQPLEVSPAQNEMKTSLQIDCLLFSQLSVTIEEHPNSAMLI